jgi:hypothetical protein
MGDEDEIEEVLGSGEVMGNALRMLSSWWLWKLARLY